MKNKPPSVALTPLETWLLELSVSVTHGLKSLSDLDRVTIKRADLGVSLSLYYNWKNVIKIDLVRMDKQPFFATPLPTEKE